MKRILSIDGGGIRGIIPVCALVALEEQTGKLTRETFDFVAGTSTGALLAAAIAAGIPAKDMLPVYTERAPKEIFVGPADLNLIARGYRYESAAIGRVVLDVLGKAWIWRLNDSPIRLLLTGMHALSGQPLYFVQDRPGHNSCKTGQLWLWQCATASAAAPTYFDPHYVYPLGGDLVGLCFDGGVGVLANPVHRACVEAFKYDDFDPADTRVVSLGTGMYTAPAGVNLPPNGLIETISFVINSMLGAAYDEQTALVEMYYPGILRRLNVELPRAIDMADMSAIPTLVQVGTEAARAINWGEVLGAKVEAANG